MSQTMMNGSNRSKLRAYPSAWPKASFIRMFQAGVPRLALPSLLVPHPMPACLQNEAPLLVQVDVAVVVSPPSCAREEARSKT